MSKYLDLFTASALIVVLIALPLYVAALAADNTRIGVLSYTFTNTKATALRF